MKTCEVNGNLLDALSFHLPIDHELTEGLSTLEPHFSGLSLSKVDGVSGDLALPKPVIANLSNWLYQDEPVDEFKREKMKAFAV